LSLARRGALAGPGRALWRRAPLWRLAVFSSALLFLLFPPGARRIASRQDEAEAKYSPAGHQMAANPSPPQQPVEPNPSSQPAQQAPGRSPSPSAPVTGPPPPPLSATGLSLATPGPAQTSSPTGLDAAVIGRLYNGSVKVVGFRIPLPPGEWALIADIKANTKIKDGGGTGSSLYLANIEHKKINAFIHVLALRTTDGSLERMRESAFTPNFCEGHKSENDGQWSCFRTDYRFFAKWSQWGDRAVNLGPDERAAAGDLAAKGVSMPNDFIAASFWRSESWGALMVEYFFNPEADGISSTPVVSAQDGDWTPGHIQKYPEKVIYAEKIRRFGFAMWPKIKEAFDAGSNQ